MYLPKHQGMIFTSKSFIILFLLSLKHKWKYVNFVILCINKLFNSMDGWKGWICICIGGLIYECMNAWVDGWMVDTLIGWLVGCAMDENYLFEYKFGLDR